MAWYPDEGDMDAVKRRKEMTDKTPSLAERLWELAEGCPLAPQWDWMRKDLRALAAEAKHMEQNTPPPGWQEQDVIQGRQIAALQSTLDGAEGALAVAVGFIDGKMDYRPSLGSDPLFDIVDSDARGALAAIRAARSGGASAARGLRPSSVPSDAPGAKSITTVEEERDAYHAALAGAAVRLESIAEDLFSKMTIIALDDEGETGDQKEGTT